MEAALRACNTVHPTTALRTLWVRHNSVLYGTNVQGTRNVPNAARQQGMTKAVNSFAGNGYLGQEVGRRSTS